MSVFYEMRTVATCAPAYASFMKEIDALETAERIMRQEPSASIMITRIQTHRQPGFWAWLRGRKRPNIQVIWSHSP